MENETLVRKKTKRRKGKKKKMTEEIKNSENEESESGNEESSESKEKQEHEKENEKKDDELISGRFDLKKNMMLGKGSFGEVYLVQDILTKNFLAMKKEFQKKTPQLKTEKNVLDMMSDYEGFPNVYEYGSHQDWNFMIMELLGPSLSDLYSYCGFKFTLQTILLIAIQMIQRIQDLHNKNFIHRDIKPENFLIGVAEKTNVVHVIDFGLVKKYKDSKTMEHIPYRETRMLTGTARYASINNHLGIEQSRRDDLEAIGYVLLFFFRRRLPWQGVDGSSQNAKYKKILEKKLSISVELLCKDLPCKSYNM